MDVKIEEHKESGVTFKAWLARDPQQKIPLDGIVDFTKLWWKRNFYPAIETIIQNLYRRKLLSEGEYILNINW